MESKARQFFAPTTSRLRGLIVGVSLSALPIVAGAAPGDFDTTFGSGGIVSISSGLYSGAHGVAIQPDGKIVVAGYSKTEKASFTVRRFHSNGSLDSGFGVYGVITTDFSPYYDDVANDIVLQPDGKIVVAGYERDTNAPDFAVARYNSNGSLDTSFSDDGKAWAAFGWAANDYGQAVALQADGKIVVAGYSHSNVAGEDDFAVARFNSNGTLDTSFGSNGLGTVTTSFNSGFGGDRAYDVFVQPDGKIVVAGYRDGFSPNFAVARYNSNGSLDTTFGAVGKTFINFGGNDTAYAAARQSDGKIVLAGCTDVWGNSDVALARFNSNGSVDSTFGTSGEVTTAVHATKYDCAYDIAIQPDGKIVVTGMVVNILGNPSVVVLRYNSNGTLDTGFGSGGIVTVLLGYAFGLSVAIQPDGKIVVAASSWGGESVFVLRFEGVPTLPPLSGIPMPTGSNYYACVPASGTTVVSTTPAAAMPLAVTNPTPTDVRVILETAAFAGPVDVIVAATLPNGQVYERGPSGWLPYPPATVLRASSSAALTLTSATDNLYAGPRSSLAPGGYMGEVWVVPAGTDLTTFNIFTSSYYRWCYTSTFP